MKLKPGTISIAAGLIAMQLMGAALAQTPSSRYEFKADSVYDKQTALTWKRCSVGQKWEKRECVGAVKAFSFDEAQRLGSGKWRVPTKDQLKTLIDPDRNEKKLIPTLDIASFPGTDPENLQYWSSTHFDDSFAAGISFGGGDFNFLGNRITRLAVRLVQPGP